MMPMEIPLAILLEVVVTLGAAALAWAIAPGDRSERRRWCVGTLAVSFGWHRAAAAVIEHQAVPAPWPVLLMLGASVVVFLAAPIVVPLLCRAVVMRRMPARWPPEEG